MTSLVLPIADFLAGGVLSLVLPLAALIAIIIWYAVLFRRGYGER